MPRRAPQTITFTIDGREVRATENSMLVDAAKHGDVEIPVFCYEPKLGQPVGACRMCLVEIEGIPKLQTGCSTPVKDGMVVYTQSERVKSAQRAVVEFLLVNHPLDCPVCDKGGECPLQDITFGWGPGRSRFAEPKRHFVKPLELSPTIAIDRERCILCYRCVRFSQEVSEDHQLVLLERGAHSYVGTFDGHPYVAPFSGNIIELCPVGALTSRPYRFRARPWEVENAGSVCALCPAQCNVSFTVRDERVLRVLAREHPEVDDGWLCDKGRFAYQSIHVEERISEPLLRESGALRPVSWERALSHAASAFDRAKGRTGAIVGGQSTNEEGYLLARLLREGLGSPHLDSRQAGSMPLELYRALGAPALQACTPDLEFAHTVLVLDAEPIDDAPVLDLRLRKGARRHGLRLALATARRSSLEESATLSLRYAPGSGGALAAALWAALTELRSPDTSSGSGGHGLEVHAQTAGIAPEEVRELARFLASGGEEIVVLWGERLTAGASGIIGAKALLGIAQELSLTTTAGAGLLEIPAGTNGRGLREVGVLPNAGPGLSSLAAEIGTSSGKDAHAIATGLAERDLQSLYLLHCDPFADLPDRPLWERALREAQTIVAHATFLTEGIDEYADVVFPAESYAEKEGTITHPDGRIQRLRSTIARPGSIRPTWRVLTDLASKLELELGVFSIQATTAQLIDDVPFYAGLTLDEIGPRGVRWQDRDAARAFPEAPSSASADDASPETSPAIELARDPAGNRSIWDYPEVEFSPTLRFLHRRLVKEGVSLLGARAAELAGAKVSDSSPGSGAPRG